MRRVNLFCPLTLTALVGVAVLGPACAQDLDTRRLQLTRGSVGEEIYGVVCDRIGAQALREDLTGDSFRAVCHRPNDGAFNDDVDLSKLPEIAPSAVDGKGAQISVDQQRRNRALAIGRLEALARRRVDLIRALDAVLPETPIPIKNLDSADETKSCESPEAEAGGEGLLTAQVADMLGRMGALYQDGTLPQSTQSLARVIEAFKSSDEAQAAWARLNGRQGYRPIETGLGVIRPIVAYPRLRDLSNASLRLLSADSIPYEVDPKRDAEGRRINVPGPANAALNTMLAAAHEELLDVKVDPKLAPLVVSSDVAGRIVLSRPRGTLELIQELLFTSDASFGSGSPTFIVKRDARGYASVVRDANLSVMAPFVDANGDGLPDIDAAGRFTTVTGALAPSPFSFPGSPSSARDENGRALAGTALVYDYLETNRTFAARTLDDLKPLVNPDPAANHETLMDMLGGVQVALGPRVASSKVFASGKRLEFSGVSNDSPVLDLVHAASVILSDKTTDSTLALGRALLTTKPTELARFTGAMNAAFDTAQKHDEAKIPRDATFWDEILGTLGKVAQEPKLLEDLLAALAAPETAELGSIFSRFANLKDEIDYDRNDINGSPWNVTTNAKAEMSTPVDRTQPETGKNRSGLYRFLQLIHDTTGVTACNKPGAKVHARLAGVGIDMPLSGGSYAECEVFKVENLAGFYLDSLANGAQFDTSDKPNKRGLFYLRDGALRDGVLFGLGAATVGLMQDSSELTGFWTDSGSRTLAPKPEWLNRLLFFDLKSDTAHARTNAFIKDLQGDFVGTSVCPERVINDPSPNAVDASSDGKVHGLRACPDGQWLNQRGAKTIFTWENFGFYDAMRPVVSAFVKHGREDLFLEFSNAMFKHWPGKEATVEECRLADSKACPRSGMNTYEPLVSEALAGDLFRALSELSAALPTLSVERCDAVDTTTKACRKTTSVRGIDVAAAATRAMLDPDYAKTTLKLADRKGVTTTTRNDGTVVPQVTPAYLFANALRAIDIAFDTFEEKSPEGKGRRVTSRRARSQLIDQFLGVTGAKSTSTFANPSVTKVGPVAIDLLRSQLAAHCPTSFVPPYDACAWARDELTKKATETLSGPLFSAGLDIADAIRTDANGRRELELLVQYLVDSASSHAALASMLASSNDLVQLLGDDENLVPLFHFLAEAVFAEVKDPLGGVVQKSLVDAQMALLAKVSGRAYDKNGKEICKREIDPNQVLAVAFGHLVTPIEDGRFRGQSPIEVILDVIADVNRDDPSLPYAGLLSRSDYAVVSANVLEFLSNKERGLEQFYEVVRRGTQF